MSSVASKTAFIRVLLCASIFVFKIGSSSASLTNEVHDPFAGIDYKQLDSIIHKTYLKYQKYPANPQIVKQLAELYAAKSETDSAVAYWRKVTDLQPQNDTAYYRQARLLYDAQQYDSSLTASQRALTLSPDKLDYLSLSAITAYHLHLEDKALAQSTRVLSISPQNINALLLCGIVLRNQHHYDDALIQFDNCLKSDPANTEGLLRRAEIYVLLKKYNDALRDYSAARADLSTNADIINNMGICYYQSGSYQQAITFFRKAIFINSRHPQGNFNSAIAHYNLHDFDSAAIDMKSASIIWDSCQTDTCHSDFLDAIYYLGLCYKKTGNLPGAKKNFELLQKEGYKQDLTTELRNINYSLFISRNWYYIVAVIILFIGLLVALVKVLRRK
jgi:tetratricopeptide (TPR) repeat protein